MQSLHWWALCTLCYGDVIAANTNTLHYIFDDSRYTGRPICEDCYNDLNLEIPDWLDVIEKSRGDKPTPDYWFNCKQCGLSFPKLNRKNLCDLCSFYDKQKPKPKEKGLDKWLYNE